MIVFGDRKRIVRSAVLLQEIRESVGALEERASDWGAHDLANRILLQTGELVQGVLDSAFRSSGHDDCGKVQNATSDLLVRTGRFFCYSYDRISGRSDAPMGGESEAASIGKGLDALAAILPSEEIETVVPEGYSCYAVYPEGYLVAARKLAPELRGPAFVIGLRSFGTGVAGAVAAALNSPFLPLTLRPGGHPFQRSLRLSEGLVSYLKSLQIDVHFVILDEGPGLSGSSLGCVADWLEDQAQADPSRIHFLPSNPGPLGFAASQRHRRRWNEGRIVVADSSEIIDRVVREIAQDKGASPDLVRDISAGRWRAELLSDKNRWPPCHLIQERRKFLVTLKENNKDRSVLIRFLGVGPYGEFKFRRAELLSDAGFIPKVHGFRYGLLVQDWLSSATPLRSDAMPRREEFITQATRYLIFLHKLSLPSGEITTSPSGLFSMASQNIEELLGSATAGYFREKWARHLGDFEKIWSPRFTDNRWQSWEWLEVASGRFLKCDTVDHAYTHDYLGPQDIKWDIAAFSLEFTLTPAEEEQVVSEIAEHTDFPANPDALRFCKECYLAFQMASYRMAQYAVRPISGAEADRLEQASTSYQQRLRFLLGCT